MELWSVQCRHNINLVLHGKIVELPLGRNFVPKVLVLLIHCKNMIPKVLILVHSSDCCDSYADTFLLPYVGTDTASRVLHYAFQVSETL